MQTVTEVEGELLEAKLLSPSPNMTIVSKRWVEMENRIIGMIEWSDEFQLDRQRNFEKWLEFIEKERLRKRYSMRKLINLSDIVTVLLIPPVDSSLGVRNQQSDQHFDPMESLIRLSNRTESLVSAVEKSLSKNQALIRNANDVKGYIDSCLNIYEIILSFTKPRFRNKQLSHSFNLISETFKGNRSESVDFINQMITKFNCGSLLPVDLKSFPTKLRAPRNSPKNRKIVSSASIHQSQKISKLVKIDLGKIIKSFGNHELILGELPNCYWMNTEVGKLIKPRSSINLSTVNIQRSWLPSDFYEWIYNAFIFTKMIVDEISEIIDAKG